MILDSSDGPFYIKEKCGWEPNNKCHITDEEFKKIKMIKYVGNWRKNADEKIKNNIKFDDWEAKAIELSEK